ncbi:MAG: hypothetical protein ACTHMI_15080 [Mucilaginibacter sp.]
MIQYAQTFIVDLEKYPENTPVIITGKVEKRKKFSNSTEGISIRDITGTVLVLVEPSSNENKFIEKVLVSSKVRVFGNVSFNSKGWLVIKAVSKIEALATPDFEFADYADEIRESYSKMLMSQILKTANSFFTNKNYIEFESRVISNHWNEEGLEPLLVVYPGFGGPAVLTTSPSAQVVEFLTTTLVSKAFTVSTSFSTSFRFPHGSAETKVIVAKATDLDMDTHTNLFWEISEKLLAHVKKDVSKNQTIYDDWSHPRQQTFENEINLILYSAFIPVVGKNWHSHIDTIVQLVDKEKNLLAEGAREQLNGDITISTITVYPGQYLNLISKGPRRQLQNLLRLYDGRRK